MINNKLVSPFLKWVGGKRQLVPEILKRLPSNLSKLTYYEPFIGGGALFFYLKPQKAIISDYNYELINVYEMVKNNVEELIADLKKHQNTSEYYYEIREIDRNPLFHQLSEIEKASRIIYLNKTCYNGLYRVNNSGEFNSPFGKYRNPNIVNEPVLRAVSGYLNSRSIQILHGDYAQALDKISEKSFVYLDPPYHPISETANFTGYVQGGWSEKDQCRLRDVCDQLNRKNIKFLLSNSSSAFIKELYGQYHIHTIRANRTINSNAEKRGPVDEVLICNYE